jgi:signal transduction histidine kinase
MSLGPELDAGAAAAPPAYRGRLFRKYFLLILALVCGALLISGAISVYFSYQENKAALASLEHEKAVAAAARIEQFVREIEKQLTFAALPQLGAGGLEQRRIEFLKLLRLVPAVTDIAQIGADGREQLSVSRLAMDVVGSGKDRSLDPAFVHARRGETWFGPVYFRKQTEPYMTIAVRSRDAVTVADVNLKFIWDVITRIKVGQRGKAYVVDSTGHLVADPDIGLVLRKTDLSALPQVKAALQGGSGALAMLARDLGGNNVLTAYAPINPLGWKVFVEQPVSEVYAALDATILRTAALLVAGLLFSALTALWLARGMVRPIRTLQEGAQRIGAGELDRRIEVGTGDELEALAGQFNDMSARLRESYAGLERKVEERTRQLSEALEHQTAITEILRVISATPTSTQPVFDAIASSALRLFEGGTVQVLVAEGGRIVSAATQAAEPGLAARLEACFPIALDRTSLCGCIVLDRATEVVPDTEADNVPEVVRSISEFTHMHSLLGAPMMREGTAIGAIVLGRKRAGEFAPEQLSLLQTFANQAAIAIENVRLFHEIEDKSRQLEVANKHKSDFLANMSHELRTPLNAIIGFSEVLMERMFGEVNEKQAEYLKDIHESGRHLLSLINDILDLSKIEAGRMELDLAEVDVPAALSNALTLVRERAQRHGIELGLQVDSRLGLFRADERKFKQILLNLLSNAVKFTPDGGRVELAAKLDTDKLEVAVRDSGIGIAPEDQAAVFEEFKQVGSDHTRKSEGTGLGLALVKRLVELHGGEIRLASAPGEGSTFSFTIPEHP